ncbi:MAG: 4Fe-4S binding protein [Candidatus Latescibacteria bacterium]|nr:4Fe-4S binding protein [Candidatus Latescibacterota bacterium]
MPKLIALIQFEKCNPETCNPKEGKCISIKACKKSIISQEMDYDIPMVFPIEICLGCGDCVKECPLGAIQIK